MTSYRVASNKEGVFSEETFLPNMHIDGTFQLRSLNIPLFLLHIFPQNSLPTVSSLFWQIKPT
jgi:hypothetical protein